MVRQLACDVNEAEEAEQRRLEGLSTPCPSRGGATHPSNERCVPVCDELMRSAGGPIRSLKKQRRAELLQTRWRCGYCTKYTDRTKDVCQHCSAPRGHANGGGGGAELLRYESRKSRSKGRQHNQVATCDAAEVKRRAAGVFDSSRKAQATREETEELEKAIGGVHYLEDQESNMSVIEGFLVVHYKGQHSIVQGAGKGAGLQTSRDLVSELEVCLD